MKLSGLPPYIRGSGFPLFGYAPAVSADKLIDTFTDANGVLLPAHTIDQDPVGNGWFTNAGIFPGGDIEIQNNAINGDTSGGTPGQQRGNSLDIDPVKYNAIFEIDFNYEILTANPQQLGIAIFNSATFQGFLILLNEGGVNILQPVGGPPVDIKTYPTGIGIHSVKVAYDGTGKVGVIIDGAPIVSFATTAPITAYDCIHVFGDDPVPEGVNIKDLCSKPSLSVTIPEIPDPKFQDTFTDTNGVLLTAHTPDLDPVGDGWVLDPAPGNEGSPEIQSNKAVFIGTTSNVKSVQKVLQNFVGSFEATIDIDVPTIAIDQIIVYVIQDDSVPGGNTSILQVGANGADVFYRWQVEDGGVGVIDTGNVVITTGSKTWTMAYDGDNAALFIDGVAVWNQQITFTGGSAFQRAVLGGLDHSSNGISADNVCMDETITVDMDSVPLPVSEGFNQAGAGQVDLDGNYTTGQQNHLWLGDGPEKITLDRDTDQAKNTLGSGTAAAARMSFVPTTSNIDITTRIVVPSVGIVAGVAGGRTSISIGEIDLGNDISISLEVTSDSPNDLKMVARSFTGFVQQAVGILNIPLVTDTDLIFKAVIDATNVTLTYGLSSSLVVAHTLGSFNKKNFRMRINDINGHSMYNNDFGIVKT